MLRAQNFLLERWDLQKTQDDNKHSNPRKSHRRDPNSGSLYSEDKDGFQELNKNGILKMRILSRNVLQRKYRRI